MEKDSYNIRKKFIKLDREIFFNAYIRVWGNLLMNSILVGFFFCEKLLGF